MMRRIWLLAAALACAGADRPSSKAKRAVDEAGERLQRATDRMEWYNRGWQLEGINVGAQGRINATRTEQQTMENPYLQARPLSAW